MPEPFGPTRATCSARSSAKVAASRRRTPDGDVEILRLDDRTPAARWVEELEAEAASLARQELDLALRLRLLLLEPRDMGHLGLRLACHLRARGAEALDEALQARDVAADAVGGLRSRVQPSGLLAAPLVPRPGEVRRAAGLQLEDGGRRRLQEPAVVRDKDHGCVDRLERLLEPLDVVDVEVVGRLVQEKQVGIAAEGARE